MNLYQIIEKWLPKTRDCFGAYDDPIAAKRLGFNSCLSEIKQKENASK